MFDHLSLAVTNLEKSLAFYDAVLKPLAVNQMFALRERGIVAYSGGGGMSFWLYAKDQQNNPLTNLQNPPRFHLAFKAENRAAVDAFYQAAIAKGGKDGGEPGIRSHYHPNYYAAYVFDLDGYKIEAVCQK